MGYEASRLGPSDSSQGPGEIRKISHRDLWSKTRSMGEIQDLEGNNWTQRNLYFLIYVYPVTPLLKSFVDEAGVVRTVGWLIQTPHTHL